MIVCAAIAGLFLIVSPPPRLHSRRRRQPAAVSTLISGSHSRAAQSVARRFARLLRLAQLERRERELRDFLVRAQTETPSLRDEQVHEVAAGLRVGPSIVMQDFLGAPIIRVRVRNIADHTVFAVLEAQVRSRDGRDMRAAIAISLAAEEARSVELLCPGALVPAALYWSASIL